MVVVMELCQRNGAVMFEETARLLGLSHIKCMRGDLIGCAVQGETGSPCIANWKTLDVTTLPAFERNVSSFYWTELKFPC